MGSVSECVFDEIEVAENWPPGMSRQTKVLEGLSKVARDGFRSNPSFLYLVSKLSQKLREGGSIANCLAAVEFERRPAVEASNPILNLIEAGLEPAEETESLFLAFRDLSGLDW